MRLRRNRTERRSRTFDARGDSPTAVEVLASLEGIPPGAKLMIVHPTWCDDTGTQFVWSWDEQY